MTRCNTPPGNTPCECLQRHRIEILRVKLVSTHFGHSWAPDEKIETFSALSHTDSIEGIASANPQLHQIKANQTSFNTITNMLRKNLKSERGHIKTEARKT